MTTTEAILIALFQHSERTKEAIFSVSDIVVITWKKFPKQFGMRGYESKYPDSKKIAGALYKHETRGRLHREPRVIEWGWLEKNDDNQWGLTEKGINEAKTLIESKMCCLPQTDSETSSEGTS
jgi:hypothetical protein